LAAKESAEAKAKGKQDELQMTEADTTFLRVLYQKKKISKQRAKYVVSKKPLDRSCVKCKFNLGDERKCHQVNEQINNENGMSAFFSPKGDGMLPGDIVWMHVREKGNKLKYKEGHVNRERVGSNAKIASICILARAFWWRASSDQR